MIFPFLNDPRFLRLARVTWSLLLINVFVFLWTYSDYQNAEEKISDLFEDDFFIRSQGLVFAQFINQHPDHYSDLLRQVADKALRGDKEKKMFLGGLAVRNAKFNKEAKGLEFEGDQVALATWRKGFKRFEELQKQHPSYLFGLSTKQSDPVKWLTYQFTHSGFDHLFINMICLLIFGANLEPLIGGLFLLLLYLGAGLLGAIGFSTFTGISMAPLVGASGAISGIMACYSVYYWRHRVRFMFFLLPIEGYIGYIMLPAWIIFAVWVATDISGYVGTLPEIGGVAYAAHLGGAVLGIFFGFVLKYFRPIKSTQEVVEDQEQALAA